MAHTYTRLYVHGVWSTKVRRPSIAPVLQAKLYRWMTEDGAAVQAGFVVPR